MKCSQANASKNNSVLIWPREHVRSVGKGCLH